MAYQVIFDGTECVACGTCAVACMDQCDLDVTKTRPYRRVVTIESGTPEAPEIRYASIGCTHCEEAPCMEVCPKQCYRRDRETGLVILLRSKCIGCGACVQACPIGAISISADGLADKCNGCRERLLFGLPPACERACQCDAIRFLPVPDRK